jgi:uroporphyrin-3 C-methyltransferase
MKGRDAWLVNETEYALNIANQQLLLSGNVTGAIVALENLLNRLNQFDKPQLLPIKKAINEDLANLRKIKQVDLAFNAFRLDQLESAVSSLPLVIDSTMKRDTNAAAKVVAPVVDANASWWEKAWAQIKDTLGGLVQVREIDNKDAMLISPEQSYFVRENLRLRLIDARIALMQRQADVYRNDLDNIETTIRQYYDLNNETVKEWLGELAKLQALNLQNNLTADLLKNSLGAVNQYQEQVLGEHIALPEVAVTPSADEASQVKMEEATASDVTASAAKVEPTKVVPAQKGRPL